MFFWGVAWHRRGTLRFPWIQKNLGFVTACLITMFVFPPPPNSRNQGDCDAEFQAWPGVALNSKVDATMSASSDLKHATESLWCWKLHKDMGSHMFLELHSNCAFLAEEYLFSLLIFGRSACKPGLGGCTGQHAESRGIVKYYEILTYAYADIMI